VVERLEAEAIEVDSACRSHGMAVNGRETEIQPEPADVSEDLSPDLSFIDNYLLQFTIYLSYINIPDPRQP